MRSHRCRRLRPLLSAALLMLPRAVSAQAWLPDKNDGQVSILFQHLFVENHLLPDGTPVDVGHITTDNMVFDVKYGLTKRIAVNFTVPFTASVYRGAYPHLSALDNQSYHGTFQDLHLEAAYQLLRGSFAVTPFSNVTAPSHAYEYFAHAAPGRRLWELQLGTNAGYAFRSGLIVQGRYSYGFAERVLGIHHDRSNADLEVAYLVSPTFRIFGMTVGQVTHGGIDVPANWRTVLPLALQPHHDQVSRANFLDLGGGAQVALSPTVDLVGSVFRTVRGANFHALDYSLTLGIEYSFGRGPMLLASRESQRHRLIKCLCQKTTTASM
jgi:hypothetical protein